MKVSGFRPMTPLPGYKEMRRSRFGGKISLGHIEVKTFVKHFILFIIVNTHLQL